MASEEAFEHWKKASYFLAKVFAALGLKDGYAIALERFHFG